MPADLVLLAMGFSGRSERAAERSGAARSRGNVKVDDTDDQRAGGFAAGTCAGPVPDAGPSPRDEKPPRVETFSVGQTVLS